jgi:hypothetical protein
MGGACPLHDLAEVRRWKRREENGKEEGKKEKEKKKERKWIVSASA